MVIVTSIVLEVFQLSIFEQNFLRTPIPDIVFFLAVCTNIITALQNALKVILKSDNTEIYLSTYNLL